MLLNQKRVINVFYGVFALLDTETDKKCVVQNCVDGFILQR